jgi:hypothetical protein
MKTDPAATPTPSQCRSRNSISAYPGQQRFCGSRVSCCLFHAIRLCLSRKTSSQHFPPPGLSPQRPISPCATFSRVLTRDSERRDIHTYAVGFAILLSFRQEPTTVRLIRVITPKVGRYVLMTSLLDTTPFPAQHFVDLYHSRWRTEDAFKRIKHRLKLEQLSGIS